MTRSQTSSDGPADRAKLALQKNDPEETLIVETPEDDSEVVLSSKSDGSSLTLLEEYSIRESNSGKWNALFAFVCAAISITFALMIFKTL